MSKKKKDELFPRTTGVDYSTVSSKPFEDKRFLREKAAPVSAPSGSMSSTFDAFHRMAAGLEGRKLADKIADPNRPTWEQYKKENEDKLDMVGADVRKMVEYRAELDRERDRKLRKYQEGAAGGGKEKEKDGKKDKRESKKRSRRHSDSSDSDSESDSESDSDSEREERRKKHKKDSKKKSKKHKKHKKESKKHKKHKHKHKQSSDDDSSSSNSSSDSDSERERGRKSSKRFEEEAPVRLSDFLRGDDSD